ncbi:RNA polymerase [Azospirillum sp. RWY-5-1]|uniref:RNA polymerase n=2 Tax=Azospirillum oleiclasticum TaxID=2735135 RepID=A0ABX2TBY0_9PROT|nr:RNA polymerase [Azospirillum oleiclasticum]NYZ21839.1 RNA polymerase [Azospirillum oleiclasticum]
MKGRMDVARHRQALRRYALSLTRNPDHAEDLVQDSVVRALAGARTWREGGDLRRWLMTILHNAHASRRRREKIELAVREAMDGGGSGWCLPPQLARVDLGETMAALASLPPDQRLVLTLVAIDGLSYREAANGLGIPVGTLMSRLARARDALRRATEHTAGDVPDDGRPRLRLVR